MRLREWELTIIPVKFKKKIITEELENVAKELIDQTIQKSFQKGMHLNICMWLCTN